MIDCWLILCQLVPFAQVVLLTAKEYLREEQQEEIEKENKEVCPIVATKTVGQESKFRCDLEKEDNIDEPQKAWTLQQSNWERTSHVINLLLLVGKDLTLTLTLKFCLQRKRWCLCPYSLPSSSTLLSLPVFTLISPNYHVNLSLDEIILLHREQQFGGFRLGVIGITLRASLSQVPDRTFLECFFVIPYRL